MVNAFAPCSVLSVLYITHPLFCSQGLSYENLANVAALQQFQQAHAHAQQQAAAQQQYNLLSGQYADYAGVDIAAAQTAPGGFLVRKWA